MEASDWWGLSAESTNQKPSSANTRSSFDDYNNNNFSYINSTAVKPATTPNSTPKSIWLPSVGALQLSDSSILKRRESAKRKRKAKENRYTAFIMT